LQVVSRTFGDEQTMLFTGHLDISNLFGGEHLALKSICFGTDSFEFARSMVPSPAE